MNADAHSVQDSDKQLTAHAMYYPHTRQFNTHIPDAPAQTMHVPFFRIRENFTPFLQGRIPINIYYVATHANLTSRPMFDPPPNVLTLFTGQGHAGELLYPSKREQETLISQFYPHKLARTIDFLLGASGFSEPQEIKNLYYAVHGDLVNGRNGALDLDLSYTSRDVEIEDAYWGLYKIENTYKVTDLHPPVPFEYTSLEMVQQLSKTRPSNELHIILFEGCRSALRTEPEIAYANSVKSLSSQSHYSVSQQPSPPIQPQTRPQLPNKTPLYPSPRQSNYNPYPRYTGFVPSLNRHWAPNRLVNRSLMAAGPFPPLSNANMAGGRGKTRRIRRKRTHT